VTFPEAEFTSPNPDCPRPEWWTAEDAQSTEVEVTALVAAFVTALQPEYVVETGTCWGFTAYAIGRALQANGHGRLVTLEVDAERARVARARCDGLPVTVVERSSMEFKPEQPIGFAWFDSLLELRIPEFERFRAWLPTGTIVRFHDTSPYMGSVYGQLVERIPGTRSVRLRTPRGVTFTEVL
jgi:hypothetical protein